MSKKGSGEIPLGDHIQHADAVQRFIAQQIGGEFDVPSSSLVSNLYSTSIIVRHDIEKEILFQENLSWTSMLMMYTLWVFGESETKVIANRLQLAPSSVTSLTNTLEKKELVVRVYKPTDRRKVLVKLTDAGVQLLSRIAKEVNKREQALTGALTDEEKQQLNDLLRKMLIHNI